MDRGLEDGNYIVKIVRILRGNFKNKTNLYIWEIILKNDVSEMEGDREGG